MLTQTRHAAHYDPHSRSWLEERKKRHQRRFFSVRSRDEVMRKILGAAFYASTNAHFRQCELVVMRNRNEIAARVAPVAKNTAQIKQAGL